jgi:hypothetical protein
MTEPIEFYSALVRLPDAARTWRLGHPKSEEWVDKKILNSVVDEMWDMDCGLIILRRRVAYSGTTYLDIHTSSNGYRWEPHWLEQLKPISPTEVEEYNVYFDVCVHARNDFQETVRYVYGIKSGIFAPFSCGSQIRMIWGGAPDFMALQKICVKEGWSCNLINRLETIEV